jgi:hypothetical protein
MNEARRGFSILTLLECTRVELTVRHLARFAGPSRTPVVDL